MRTLRKSLRLTIPVEDVKLTRFGDRQALLNQDLQKSYEQGRRDGEQALNQQLVQQRAEVIELQTGVLTSLRNVIPQLTRDCERALIEVALVAARKLVADLPVSAEMIEAIVKEACAEVGDTSEFSVLLNPEDFALMQQTNSSLLSPEGGQEQIHFQTSPQVSRGGCIVQTRFGTLDARRETRFEMLRQSLGA